MSAQIVADRLAEVRRRIAAAETRSGRGLGSVTLVAVTKTVELPEIRGALLAGQRDLGENRAQELLAKAAVLEDVDDAEAPVWHFVGRLQSNKVRMLAPWVSCWHSIDRPELADVLARHAPAASVYIEVNLAGEPQKAGCAPGETGALVDRLASAGASVEGHKTVPTGGAEPRPGVARLRPEAMGLGLQRGDPRRRAAHGGGGGGGAGRGRRRARGRGRARRGPHDGPSGR